MGKTPRKKRTKLKSTESHALDLLILDAFEWAKNRESSQRLDESKMNMTMAHDLRGQCAMPLRRMTAGTSSTSTRSHDGHLPLDQSAERALVQRLYRLFRSRILLGKVGREEFQEIDIINMAANRGLTVDASIAARVLHVAFDRGLLEHEFGSSDDTATFRLPLRGDFSKLEADFIQRLGIEVLACTRISQANNAQSVIRELRERTQEMRTLAHCSSDSDDRMLLRFVARDLDWHIQVLKASECEASIRLLQQTYNRINTCVTHMRSRVRRLRVCREHLRIIRAIEHQSHREIYDAYRDHFFGAAGRWDESLAQFFCEWIPCYDDRHRSYHIGRQQRFDQGIKSAPEKIV